jgi:hypothetical protein
MDNNYITETLFYIKFVNKYNQFIFKEINQTDELYNEYYSNKKNYYFMTFILTSGNKMKKDVLRGNINEILIKNLICINSSGFNMNVIGVNLIYIDTNLLIKSNIEQPVEELSIDVITNRIWTFRKYFKKYCKFMKTYHSIKEEENKVKKFPKFMKHIKDEQSKINLMIGFDYLYKIIVELYMNNNDFIRKMNYNSIYVIALENCIMSHCFLKKLDIENSQTNDLNDLKKDVEKNSLEKLKKKYNVFCYDAYFKNWFDVCLLAYQKLSFTNLHINVPEDENICSSKIDYGVYFDYSNNDNYYLSVSSINIEIPTNIILRYFYSFDKKYLTTKLNYLYNLSTNKFKKEDNLFSRTFGSYISNPDNRKEINFSNYESTVFNLPPTDVNIEHYNWMYFTSGIDRVIQIDSVVNKLSIVPKLLGMFLKEFYELKRLHLENMKNLIDIKNKDNVNVKKLPVRKINDFNVSQISYV